MVRENKTKRQYVDPSAVVAVRSNTSPPRFIVIIIRDAAMALATMRADISQAELDRIFWQIWSRKVFDAIKWIAWVWNAAQEGCHHIKQLTPCVAPTYSTML